MGWLIVYGDGLEAHGGHGGSAGGAMATQFAVEARGPSSYAPICGIIALINEV